MAWILTITPSPGSDIETIEAQLWSLGTTGIAETSAPGIETLVAGFEDEAAAIRARRTVETAGWTASVRPIDPNTWPTPEPRQVTVGDRVLHIEVGHAFGHGAHATTQLALEALPRLVTTDTSVLDVGTGTGILALAAAALGARPVVGIDVDPDAIRIATRNAATNALDIIVTNRPLADLAPGADHPQYATGPFDLVVVNMLAADLAPIASQVAAQLGTGGTLFLTGFVHEQQPWVESMFPGCELAGERIGADDWASVTLRRTQES